MVSLVTSSSFACTPLYFGIVSNIMTASAAAITRAAPKNMSESFKSMIIAMTIAPTAMKGARKTRRMNIATPCWHWLTSAVSLVMSEVVENLSSSE